MTNLNVPGLADVCRRRRLHARRRRSRARRGARGRARRHRREEPRARSRWPRRSAATRRSLLAANAEDVAGRASGGTRRGVRRPPDADAEEPSRRWRTGSQQIAALPDPVGEITDLRYRPTGIQVGRMRVPLGVVGIIYESRPNVTADAAGLCLKSGNATILRGGSEAHPQQSGDRRLRAPGPARGRPARERRAGRRDHRSRGRRPSDRRRRSTSTSSCRAAARA